MHVMQCLVVVMLFPRKRESGKDKSVHPELVEGFYESLMNGSTGSP